MDNTTLIAEPHIEVSAEFVPPESAAHKIGWTDRQFEHLKTCWADGMSAAGAAAEINYKFKTAYTRNAIIGKVSRHGLSGVFTRIKGAGGRVRSPRPAKKAAIEQRQKEAAAAVAIDDLAIPFEQRKSLAQLETGDCKWPVGDPSTPDLFFCGGRAMKTSPYCAGHFKRSIYQRAA